MSDKERKKKDGRNKDKKNKAMHDRENDRKLTPGGAPQQAKDASNLTGSEAGAADSNRKTNQQ
jgi:hypothetical protein